MRLNRYLSQCGVASRRGAEEIILGGRVSINGHIVTELATQVQPEDKVVVDGSPVRTELPLVIALHKPKGYLCSRGDTHERMTIYDLLPGKFQTLHHVGRLDKESEGLLLLTNRGDLSHRLIHPSQGAEKEYEVVVDQPMTAETMAKLVKGMLTEEGYARAERAWLDTAYRAHVVLKQGLKRQIRLMFYHLGYEVERLTRVRIGWLKLHGLPKGGWKELTPTEVERFFKEEPSKGREPPPRVRKPAGPSKRPYSKAVPARPDNDETGWGDDEVPQPRQPRERASGPGRGPRGGDGAKSGGRKPTAASKRPSARSAPSRSYEETGWGDEEMPRDRERGPRGRGPRSGDSRGAGPSRKPRGRGEGGSDTGREARKPRFGGAGPGRPRGSSGGGSSAGGRKSDGSGRSGGHRRGGGAR